METAAVDGYLAVAGLVCSALLLVEARRALARRAPDRLPRLDLVLARVNLVDTSAAVVESAGRLPDPMLRSLDSIHLATALMLRDDIDAVVTYDDRFAAAATAHGLTVEAPGRAYDGSAHLDRVQRQYRALGGAVPGPQHAAVEARLRDRARAGARRPRRRHAVRHDLLHGVDRRVGGRGDLSVAGIAVEQARRGRAADDGVAAQHHDPRTVGAHVQPGGDDVVEPGGERRSQVTWGHPLNGTKQTRWWTLCAGSSTLSSDTREDADRHRRAGFRVSGATSSRNAVPAP